MDKPQPPILSLWEATLEYAQTRLDIPCVDVPSPLYPLFCWY